MRVATTLSRLHRLFTLRHMASFSSAAAAPSSADAAAPPASRSSLADAPPPDVVASPFVGRVSDGSGVAPPGLRVISEGGAAVLVRPGEVFYNPVQVFNRDLSVMALRAWLAYRSAHATPKDVLRAHIARGVAPGDAPAVVAAAGGAFPPARIMEALSATGLRSLRYASELPQGAVGVIVANDLEPAAAAAIRANVAFNGAAAIALVQPSAGDANLVMGLAARGLPLLPDMASWMGGRAVGAGAPAAAGSAAPAQAPGDAPSPPREGPFLFDSVDLDPYGTAAPFLDAALACIAEGGLLAVTCTDMAVLAGNHQDACRVKYGAVPVKGRHFGEQALRIVLGAIETAANRHKKAVTPLASVCVDFYVRVFVSVSTSASAAATASLRLSQIHQCTGCDSFWLWPLGRDGGSRGGGAGGGRGIEWAADGALRGGVGGGVGMSGVGGGASVAVGEAPAGGAGALAAVEGMGSAEPRVAADSNNTGDAAMVIDDGAGAGMQAASGAAAASPAAAAVGSGEKPPRNKHGGLNKRERRQARQAQEEAAPSPARAAAHVVPNAAPDLPCACPHCGRAVVVGGPLWSAPIHEPQFLEALLTTATANFGEDGTGAAAGVAAGVVAGDGKAATAPVATASAPPAPHPASPAWSPPGLPGVPSYYDLAARATPRGPTDGGSNSTSVVAASRRRLLGVLRSLREELPDAPLLVEASTLASRLRLSTLPLPDLQAAFLNAGYRCSGSHTAPGTIKTDAPPAVWWAVMRAVKAAQEAAAAKAKGVGGAGGGGAEAAPSIAETTANEVAPTSSAAAVPLNTTAAARPPPRHATFVPDAVRALGAMPLAAALASPLSLAPTAAELPPGAAISFEWPAELVERQRVRAEERDRGAGQRFVPNPGAGWGPMARAHGDKKRRTVDNPEAEV